MRLKPQGQRKGGPGMEEVPEIGGVQTEEEETMSKNFKVLILMKILKLMKIMRLQFKNTPKNINQ